MAPIVRPMRPLLVLMRAALGGGVDRRILPVAGVTFIYSASFSTFWVYVGVYAVKGLHWPASRVGLLFLFSAPVAAVANYLSGRVSDRVGRRRPIVASFLASAANVAALSLLGHRTAIAFALIVLQGVIGAPAYSLDRVLVADLVLEPAGHENAFATVRVAGNLGAFGGPPLAALLIFLGGWTAFLIGISALGIVGAVLASAGLRAAILLMGLPFLGLGASGGVAVIAGVIVAFVFGEMLWMPTSQSVAARLAPAAARGTYFGALAAMTGPAWTFAPFVALQLRAHAGIDSVWILFAAVAVAGAAAGVAAVRAADADLSRRSGCA